MPLPIPGTSNLVVFGDSLSDNGNLFHLVGQPQPPYWEGRFSNGPTYAEQLAKWLGVPLTDLAFGGATASRSSPGILKDPAGNPLPINLPEQVAGYVAGLNGHKPPSGTTAVLYVGSNDYLNYLSSSMPKDLLTAGKVVANVVGSVNKAINDLSAAGVKNIALFTLPDLAITPALQAQGSDAANFAHGLDVANNLALQGLAAIHPNVQLVDMFKLSDAVAADPTSFGLTDVTTPMVDLLAAGSTQFAPNEVGFFDGIHPTYAGHGIQAAFASAELGSNHVQFLDGMQKVVRAGPGNNFIFATPVDSGGHRPHDNYTIFGGSGFDQIIAGSGNVTVHGGPGTELIAAGSGNAKLFGGNGTDVLATNSLGTNLLEAGNGRDALIANRGGTNQLQGGTGNDLFELKENASLFNPDNGAFDFGTQTIDGGQGLNTLKFVINDQIPGVVDALAAEFNQVDAAFRTSIAQNHPGTFQVDGLNVTGIDRVQLEVDSVSNNPNTPYLITQNIVASDGSAPGPGAQLNSLLTTAGHWGLLTV